MKHEIELTLDGRLLKRGFWIYVWKIYCIDNRQLYYVGRTGDSSSNNAASPFNRMSAHLNPKGKGNSLYKNLLIQNVDLENATLKMYAYGPLFKEQENFENHKIIRDKVAVIERQVALNLIQSHCTVMGIHSAPREAEENDLMIANEITKNAKRL